MGGADTLTGGAGADTLALGAPDAAADTVAYTASGETDNRSSGFFVDSGSTSAMDVITQAQPGDKLKVWDGFLAGETTVTTTYLTDATTNKVAIVQGALDGNGNFMAGTGGSNDDYIVQWADGTQVHSVVLKDYGTIAPTLTVDAAADTLTLALDTTAPTVTSVTVPANKTYKLGDTLSFTVNTSENVTVTGTPQLALTLGSTTVQANYASGSGTSALVFSYTVADADLDTDGIAVDTLALNGGTLRDEAGNAMTLTLNSVVATTGVKVDGVIATVTTTSAAYTEASDTLTLTGANFDTLLESGEDATTDIKARLDWSKLVWDINGDDATTANVSFAESDISSAKVSSATTLTVVLTATKGTALEGTTGYGVTGNADTLDIAAGFAKDAAGNAATTDALANGALAITVPDTTAPSARLASMVQLEAIDKTNGDDLKPQITAVGSGGDFVVTWQGEHSDTGDYSIFVQKFAANGTPTGSIVQLEALGNSTGFDRSPQITAVGSGGDFVATWEGIDSAGDSSIFVQKFTANGVPSGGSMVQLEAIGVTDGYDGSPQITAVGSSGDFVLTWEGVDSAGDRSIFVQKFGANGTPTGSMVQLEALGRTSGIDILPQITAVGSLGDFVVTWQGQDSVGDFSIFVQKFAANGTPTGSMVQLEALDRTNGSDEFPQITAVGSGGEFAVTWYGQDSAVDYSIFVQPFNAAGQALPGTLRTNTSTPVTVQSSEAGTAYLVKSTVTVNTLADITSAQDAQWNQVAIATANTDTALATTGLEDGSYRIYTADAAGNLSAPVTGVEVVGLTA